MLTCATAVLLLLLCSSEDTTALTRRDTSRSCSMTSQLCSDSSPNLGDAKEDEERNTGINGQIDSQWRALRIIVSSNHTDSHTDRQTNRYTNKRPVSMHAFVKSCRLTVSSAAPESISRHPRHSLSVATASPRAASGTPTRTCPLIHI